MRSYFLLPEKRVVWSACIMLNKCLSGHWPVCYWRPFCTKFPARVLAVKLGSTQKVTKGPKRVPKVPAGNSQPGWCSGLGDDMGQQAPAHGLVVPASALCMPPDLTYQGWPARDHPTSEKQKGFKFNTQSLGCDDQALQEETDRTGSISGRTVDCELCAQYL